MTDLARPLSVETLRARGACERAQALFRERWGDSVEVTEARCVSVADLFDWDCAAQKLLSPTAWAEYRRAGAPASDEYRRVRATAWARLYVSDRESPA